MFTYSYVGTNDLGRATRFYDAVLAVIGLPRCITGDDFYAAYVREPDRNKLAAVCRGFTKPQ